MLWDVSWDQNNVLDDRRYSEFAFEMLKRKPVTTTMPPSAVANSTVVNSTVANSTVANSTVANSTGTTQLENTTHVPATAAPKITTASESTDRPFQMSRASFVRHSYFCFAWFCAGGVHLPLRAWHPSSCVCDIHLLVCVTSLFLYAVHPSSCMWHLSCSVRMAPILLCAHDTRPPLCAWHPSSFVRMTPIFLCAHDTHLPLRATPVFLCVTSIPLCTIPIFLRARYAHPLCAGGTRLPLHAW